MLHELDPAGAAGCKHGKRRLVEFLGGDAADELVGLLQDGEVGSDVHVEDLDVTQHTDGLDHLGLHMGSGRHVEALAQGSGYGRSREEYDVLLGIRNCIPYIVDIALLVQSADRTCDDTLAAADAGGGIKSGIEGRTYTDIISAADLADGADCLNVVAGGDAAQALDTFVVVTDHVRCRIIDVIRGFLALEVIFINGVVISQLLQFAVVAAHAGETFFAVRGEDELDRGLSGSTDCCGIGENFHSLFYRVGTCGSQTPAALDLDDADTAGADAVDILEVAKRRNLDFCLFGRLQDACALRNSDRDIIDFIYTASNLQFCLHRPHLMQVSISI